VLFDQLSFDLQRGQVMQVAGSNGSGKTTLLRMVCGLNDSYEGSIEWQPDDPNSHFEAFLANLIYIGHRAGVNKILTPLENLRWSCGIQVRADDEELLEALARVGLRGFEESQCFTLSAGQQQRVSLARLLACPAAIWILDEPFTTLDATGVQWLEQLIHDHASAGGGVMITTHHQLRVDNLSVLSLG